MNDATDNGTDTEDPKEEKEELEEVEDKGNESTEDDGSEVLAMSDSDFMEYMQNMPEEGHKDGPEEGNVPKDDAAKEEGEGEEGEEGEEGDPKKLDEDAGSESPEENKKEVSELEEEGTEDSGERLTDASDKAESKTESKAESKSRSSLPENTNKIFEEFKANGQAMQVSSAEEVITLMQKGANYDHKMRQVGESLKVSKLLEKNNINEDRLNYLIDLHLNKKEAINQLVSESKLDPLDIDKPKEGQYVPETKAISQQEIDLDQVIIDIENTPSYAKTIDIVGNRWDVSSKQSIGESPEILRAINDHMGNGIYDVINKEVYKQRALGNLRGMDDLTAYKTVGDYLDGEGAFNELTGNSNKPVQKDIRDVAKKVTNSNTEDINRKRKAASPTRSEVGSTLDSGENPLSMSDEEFQNKFGASLGIS